jgi:outer membrane lipoprotein-sorting protein
VYHVGIIDYLQVWSFNKRVENKLKSWTSETPNEISAIPPMKYAQRFKKFMQENVFVELGDESFITTATD